MGMLTYITRTGHELVLHSADDCATAIRRGDLHPHSIVMDTVSGRWLRAQEHPALADLFGRIQPESPAQAPIARFKGATIAVWILAIGGPALLALGRGADVTYVLVRTLLCTALLCAVGVIALLFIRSERGRWRLSIVLATLTLAAGAAVLVSGT